MTKKRGGEELNGNSVAPDRVIIGLKAACEVLGGISEKTLRKTMEEYPIPWLRFGGKQKPSIRLKDLLAWHDKFPPYKPPKSHR